MDHLLVHQSKKLLEIQEVQTDYLDDLMKVVERIDGRDKNTHAWRKLLDKAEYA